VEPIVLYYFSAVLVLGTVAQWLAWRLRLPSILLLLIFGVVAGHWIDPDELIGTRVLFPVVSLSVALILFEGGMSLKLSELKDSGVAVFRLTTLGVLLAWVLGGVAAWWLLGLTAC